MKLEDGTYQPGSGELQPVTDYHHGYWVALPGYEVILGAIECHAETVELLRQLALAKKAYVGVSSHDDRTYFELTVWFGDFSLAIAAGKKWDQLSIWDIANNRPISISEIPYTVEHDGILGQSTLSLAHAAEQVTGRLLRRKNGFEKD